MRYLMVSLLAVLLGACFPCEGGGGGAGGACACDCPDGPPGWPAISTYCSDEANDGEPCCLGPGTGEGPIVGTCQSLECVAEASQ